MTAFNTSAGGARERPPPKNETPGRGGSRPEADFKNSSNTTAYTARHRSLQECRTAELRRLRRQRYAKRIWPLGERVEFELIEHLITAFDLDEDAVDRVLGRFAGLDADVLRELGGDKLPASPIHAVGGAR
jgi:hypothetical protein